jgi:drug/metabolite transporter (DMT)-like permease
LLPLANAITIHFSSALFLTAFSALLLREPVGASRSMALGLGFLGVVAMAKPTQLVWDAGIGVALLFAIIDAVIMLNVRILTRTDSSAAIVIYFSLFASLVTGLALPFIWHTPTLTDAVLLSVLGLGGGLGQLFLTQAYRHAPAATVAPMIYSALLWSMMLGFLFWGEVPTLTLLMGASLIVVSGLYIIYEEATKHHPITVLPPQALGDEDENKDQEPQRGRVDFST